MIDRNRMLEDLTSAMRRHHARRRTRHRLAGTLALAAAATGAILITTPRSEPRRGPMQTVTVVHGSPRTGLIRTIDDKELLDRLAEIARPTGLIRTGGAAWLTDPPV